MKNMKNMKMHRCIVCLKPLESEAFNREIRDSIGVIYDGLICRTSGNYGSRIYDDTTGNEYVEFVVCDKCAKKRAKYMVRIVTKRSERQVVSAGEFCPATAEEIKRSKAYRKARREGKLIVGVPHAKKVTLFGKAKK